MEALYTFPVPKAASVANFSMWINGKEMVGEVVEKKRAREIYDSYKQVRRDPAVVKSAGAFGADLRQAARSGGELIHEVRSAWIRTDGRGTPTSSPAVA